MAKKLRPLHGFVQIQDLPVTSERKTASGLIIQVVKEPRLRYGHVVDLGTGVDKKNRPVFHDCKVGDLVIYDCYMGNQFDDDSYLQGGSWRVVSPDQILGVVEDPPANLADLPPLSDKNAHK